MSEDEPPKTPEVEMEQPVETSKAEHENKIAEKNTKIKDLEGEIATREEKIGNLFVRLNTADEEIKTLKSAEDESKEAVKDLEHRLSQKELEITRLE